MSDFRQTVGFIRKIHRNLYRRVDKKLIENKMPLVSTQVSIIIHLLLEGPLMITEIAEKIDKNNSTTNYMIGKLVEYGYLKKKQGKEDKRVWYAYLDKKALDEKNFFLGIMEENLDILYKNFSEEEKRLFIVLLNKMVVNTNNLD